MPRKVLIIALAGTIPVFTACTKARKEAPAPAVVAAVTPASSSAAKAPRPAPQRTPPRDKPPVAETAAPAPRTTQPELPSLIQASASWVEYGKTLSVTRGQSQPVPLFRQAIVLAAVRSAVAGSAAAPRAEFRNGRLTLAFDRGTNPEIAAAVNRALSVPEVTRLEIQLPVARSG